MTSIRDILANNLKENRKRCGFSQAKLAEEADTSTQYIAMIEISRKFPTPEMLNRLAKALGIEAYELFMVKPSPEDVVERLYDALVINIERAIDKAVEKAISKRLKR